MSIGIIRWNAKKLARLVTALIPNSSRSKYFRVLTYHNFDLSTNRSPFTISRSDFERQIRFLAESGIGITKKELLDPEIWDLPNIGRVIVTIDDGHESNLRHAIPILNRYNIGAILFVVPSWIGSEGFLNNNDILQISKNGFLIGSHAMTHRLLASLSYESQFDEAQFSKKILEDITGASVTTFAYPYGTQDAFNSSTRTALANAGYRIAFTSQHGAIAPGLDKLTLPRIKIESGDPFWVFRRACTGSLDRWRYIDELLTFMQRPPR